MVRCSECQKNISGVHVSPMYRLDQKFCSSECLHSKRDKIRNPCQLCGISEMKRGDLSLCSVCAKERDKKHIKEFAREMTLEKKCSLCSGAIISSWIMGRYPDKEFCSIQCTMAADKLEAMTEKEDDKELVDLGFKCAQCATFSRALIVCVDFPDDKFCSSNCVKRFREQKQDKLELPSLVNPLTKPQPQTQSQHTTCIDCPSCNRRIDIALKPPLCSMPETEKTYDIRDMLYVHEQLIAHNKYLQNMAECYVKTIEDLQAKRFNNY